LSSNSPGDSGTDAGAATNHGRPLARARSSVAIRANTPAQSPGLVWRNSRNVGYHGVSSRSLNQRLSAANGSATHAATLSAPARCATDVSLVTTRSRLAITAAVSRNAPPASSSEAGSANRPTGNPAASNCSAPSPFWRLTSRTPGQPASGANWASGIDRSASAPPYVGLPCQAMPTLNPGPSAASRCSHRPTRFSSARRYCTSAGTLCGVVTNMPGRLINRT
jgi:hypothetical protein